MSEENHKFWVWFTDLNLISEYTNLNNTLDQIDSCLSALETQSDDLYSRFQALLDDSRQTREELEAQRSSTSEEGASVPGVSTNQESASSVLTSQDSQDSKIPIDTQEGETSSQEKESFSKSEKDDVTAETCDTHTSEETTEHLPH